ncbi:MAG: CHAD domain-containing protein [Sumerlaeia bacterium]
MKTKAASQFLERIVVERLRGYLQVVEEQWPVLLEPGSNVPIHEQRKAINRMRSMRRILKDAGLADELQEPIKQLRSWQRLLSPARDLDVTMDWIETLASRTKSKKAKKGSAMMLERLREKRRGVVEVLAEALDRNMGEETRAAIKELTAWAEVRPSSSGTSNGHLGSRSQLDLERALVGAFHDKWLERRAVAARQMTGENLHDFRKTNKRLRDAAGFLRDHVEDSWGAVYDALDDIHDAIGAMNDLRVLRAEILSERARHKPGGKKDKRLASLQKEGDRLFLSLSDDMLECWHTIHGGAIESRLALEP